MSRVVSSSFPRLRCACKVLLRRLSSSSSSPASEAAPLVSLAPLSHRSLLLLRGADSAPFLQGLLTADLALLQPAGALYSMLLNAQGRVLYDVLLYGRREEEEEGGVLMECDAKAALDVLKHLKRYALRSKVEVAVVDEEYKLWGLFPGAGESQGGVGGDCQSAAVAAAADSYTDPRVSSFSTRLISKPGLKASDICPNVPETTVDAYHRHRLHSGIAEGVEELPVGNCLPLEYNLDYLNGVSFTKGCYLGQELTARTHHTGVIRKRVMPITLSTENVELPPGSSVQSSSGKRAGKLVCQRWGAGLALLRLQELSKELAVESADGEKVSLTAHQPSWWP